MAAGWLFSQTAPSANQNTPAQSSLEDAYRANNIGVALLEQFKYKEAADEFRRALKIEPSLALGLTTRREEFHAAGIEIAKTGFSLDEMKRGAPLRTSFR